MLLALQLLIGSFSALLAVALATDRSFFSNIELRDALTGNNFSYDPKHWFLIEAEMFISKGQTEELSLQVPNEFVGLPETSFSLLRYSEEIGKVVNKDNNNNTLTVSFPETPTSDTTATFNFLCKLSEKAIEELKGPSEVEYTFKTSNNVSFKQTMYYKPKSVNQVAANGGIYVNNKTAWFTVDIPVDQLEHPVHIVSGPKVSALEYNIDITKTKCELVKKVDGFNEPLESVPFSPVDDKSSMKAIDMKHNGTGTAGGKYVRITYFTLPLRHSFLENQVSFSKVSAPSISKRSFKKDLEFDVFADSHVNLFPRIDTTQASPNSGLYSNSSASSSQTYSVPSSIISTSSSATTGFSSGSSTTSINTGSSSDASNASPTSTDNGSISQPASTPNSESPAGTSSSEIPGSSSASSSATSSVTTGFSSTSSTPSTSTGSSSDVSNTSPTSTDSGITSQPTSTPNSGSAAGTSSSEIVDSSSTSSFVTSSVTNTTSSQQATSTSLESTSMSTAEPSSSASSNTLVQNSTSSSATPSFSAPSSSLVQSSTSSSSAPYSSLTQNSTSSSTTPSFSASSSSFTENSTSSSTTPTSSIVQSSTSSSSAPYSSLTQNSTSSITPSFSAPFSSFIENSTSSSTTPTITSSENSLSSSTIPTSSFTKNFTSVPSNSFSLNSGNSSISTPFSSGSISASGGLTTKANATSTASSISTTQISSSKLTPTPVSSSIKSTQGSNFTTGQFSAISSRTFAQNTSSVSKSVSSSSVFLNSSTIPMSSTSTLAPSSGSTDYSSLSISTSSGINMPSSTATAQSRSMSVSSDGLSSTMTPTYPSSSSTYSTNTTSSVPNKSSSENSYSGTGYSSDVSKTYRVITRTNNGEITSFTSMFPVATESANPSTSGSPYETSSVITMTNNGEITSFTSMFPVATESANPSTSGSPYETSSVVTITNNGEVTSFTSLFPVATESANPNSPSVQDTKGAVTEKETGQPSYSASTLSSNRVTISSSIGAFTAISGTQTMIHTSAIPYTTTVPRGNATVAATSQSALGSESLHTSTPTVTYNSFNLASNRPSSNSPAQGFAGNGASTTQAAHVSQPESATRGTHKITASATTTSSGREASLNAESSVANGGKETEPCSCFQVVETLTRTSGGSWSTVGITQSPIPATTAAGSNVNTMQPTDTAVKREDPATSIGNASKTLDLQTFEAGAVRPKISLLTSILCFIMLFV